MVCGRLFEIEGASATSPVVVRYRQQCPRVPAYSMRTLRVYSKVQRVTLSVNTRANAQGLILEQLVSAPVVVRYSTYYCCSTEARAKFPNKNYVDSPVPIKKATMRQVRVAFVAGSTSRPLVILFAESLPTDARRRS